MILSCKIRPRSPVPRVSTGPDDPGRNCGRLRGMNIVIMTIESETLSTFPIAPFQAEIEKTRTSPVAE